MGINDKALLALLDRCGESLYALLTRLTLREDVADDLMQELFLKLSRSEKFANADDPKAYVHRAAINLAMDWWQGQKESAVPLGGVAERAGAAENPLAAIIKREEMDEVLRAVSQLNKNYREIFVMRYIERQSYEEIGVKLGRDTHHIRALCSKALSELKRWLNETTAADSGEEVCDGQI